MRSDVHIIENYLREVKRWFTLSNLILSGKVEIGLLAYDPRHDELYHIESALGRTNAPLRLKSTLSISGESNENGLDYFSSVKFESDVVKSFLGRLSAKERDHKRVLVVRDIDSRQSESVRQEARAMHIEIWFMQSIIQSLAAMDIKNSSDDVLRTIELCREALKRY